MKSIFILSALFLGSTLSYADVNGDLTKKEARHAQEIVSCPHSLQSKSNRNEDQRTVASLISKKEKKEKKQEVTK